MVQYNKSDLIKRKNLLQLFFRINTFGSAEQMKMEIQRHGEKKFPFLHHFYENLEDIKNMRNLKPILDFTRALMDHFNHKITRK